MSGVDLDRVGSIIERVAESTGLELVGWELKGEGSRSMLRIVVDRDEGLTHADCVAVNDEVGTILDVEDLIPFAYTLEITSPGLGKALSGQPAFDRHRGEVARVRAATPLDGRTSFKGRIERVTPRSVTLVDAHGRAHELAYDDILAANLVHAPRSAKRGPGAGGEQ